MTGQRYSGSNQPPQHGEPRTDPWGWLYREDGHVEPVESPPPVQRDHAYGYDLPSASSQDFPGEQGYPEYHAGQPAAGFSAPPVPPPAVISPGFEPPREERRGRGPMIGLIVGALVLVLALAAFLVYLTQTGRGGADAPPSSQPSGQQGQSGDSEEASQQPSGDATYDGEVAPINATGALAPCVVDDATDASGDPVTYGAENAVDGDMDTAWRCDGDGLDETIRVSLPSGSTVAQVGLVNGYAKVDPGDQSRRYEEYRRIARVQWEFSNGTTAEQDLKDKTESMQTLAVPVQEDVDWVEVTIVTSTAPGSDEATRDAVLISEIQVSAPS